MLLLVMLLCWCQVLRVTQRQHLHLLLLPLLLWPHLQWHWWGTGETSLLGLC